MTRCCYSVSRGFWGEPWRQHTFFRTWMGNVAGPYDCCFTKRRCHWLERQKTKEMTWPVDNIQMNRDESKKESAVECCSVVRRAPHHDIFHSCCLITFPGWMYSLFLNFFFCLSVFCLVAEVTSKTNRLLLLEEIIIVWQSAWNFHSGKSSIRNNQFAQFGFCGMERIE